MLLNDMCTVVVAVQVFGFILWGCIRKIDNGDNSFCPLIRRSIYDQLEDQWRKEKSTAKAHGQWWTDARAEIKRLEKKLADKVQNGSEVSWGTPYKVMKINRDGVNARFASRSTTFEDALNGPNGAEELARQNPGDTYVILGPMAESKADIPIVTTRYNDKGEKVAK